jgi:hypothetical protein
LGSIIGSAVNANANYGGRFEGYFNGGTGNYCWGVKGEASDGNVNNFGGEFIADDGIGTNFGVTGTATDATTNYGGKFAASGGTSNYGIYASVPNTQTPTNCAGYFNGNAYASGVFVPSDEALKQDIQPLVNGLSTVLQLEPKSYNYRLDEFSQMNLPQNINFGLIASEARNVLPGIVEDFVHPEETDTLGNIITPAVNFQAINYTAIVPFLIASIKEQQQQIKELSTQLSSCCSLSDSESNKTEEESTVTIQQLNSSAKDLPVLSQNRPNPFNEKSIIRFYLPKGTKNGSIKVFDTNGAVYRLFALTGEGPGTIEIEANTLEGGTYYYSLLIENSVIDTKTMVITK